LMTPRKWKCRAFLLNKGPINLSGIFPLTPTNPCFLLQEPWAGSRHRDWCQFLILNRRRPRKRRCQLLILNQRGSHKRRCQLPQLRAGDVLFAANLSDSKAIPVTAHTVVFSAPSLWPSRRTLTRLPKNEQIGLAT